jgi:hypothetical protein
VNYIQRDSARVNPKSNSLEIRREKWLRQLMADPKVEHGALKVALAIGFHFNRSRGGVAWPGTNTIAEIAHIGRMTVFRAVRKLEERGHLQVTRTRKGRRNLPNRYVLVIKQSAERGSRNVTSALRVLHAMVPPSITAMRPPSTIAMVPEPYTEPLSEPHIPIRISDATSVAFDNNSAASKGSEERGIREGNEREESTSSISDAPSLASTCFSLAEEKHWGPEARAVVAKALNITAVGDTDCLADIQDVIDEGGTLEELAQRLWRP